MTGYLLGHSHFVFIYCRPPYTPIVSNNANIDTNILKGVDFMYSIIPEIFQIFLHKDFEIANFAQ